MFYSYLEEDFSEVISRQHCKGPAFGGLYLQEVCSPLNLGCQTSKPHGGLHCTLHIYVCGACYIKYISSSILIQISALQ